MVCDGRRNGRFLRVATTLPLGVWHGILSDASKYKKSYVLLRGVTCQSPSKYVILICSCCVVFAHGLLPDVLVHFSGLQILETEK
jgi:hypothetical protein